MMKGKNLAITIVLSLIIVVLFTLDEIYSSGYNESKSAYLVYLDGKKIGLINNEQSLYDLINNEQQEIKNKYNVDHVYPPTGFELTEVNTFNQNYMNVEDVYREIEKEDNFTIKGYIITIKSSDKDKKDIVINVLDKEVFNKAINNFILSFISQNQLEEYLKGNISIDKIGSIISKMYFNETITIKEGYISVNEDIYTDAESLSQYLLFGPDAQMDRYTVKLGDTIDSISEEHQLSSQEFIIANPIYRDTTTMLVVGSVVNMTLTNPVLTLVYEMNEIGETVTPFTKDTVVDTTKGSDFSEITTPGVNGITRTHISYQVVNGERNSEVRNVEDPVVVQKMVKQVTTVGRRQSYVIGNYVDNGGDWGYPTNYPYYVTSPYGWRGKKVHQGIDLSGTGYGSPIYAVADGTVVEVGSRSTDGLFVILQHENDLYTQYAHLSRQLVKVGQTVKKGDRIGQMGDTGVVTGTHLHFGVCKGYPYHGNYQFQNPRNYIKF